MKNVLVIYPGGYHGEFFIGNIVSNTDKFHYHSFECRSKEFNAYNYESTGNEIAHEQSAEDLKRCSELHNKPIIARSCDHHLRDPITKTKKSLNIIHLHSDDHLYRIRAKLLFSIKQLDKAYNHENGILDSVPTSFIVHKKDFGWTAHVPSDRIVHIDIKDWLHNDHDVIGKIEWFLGIEYTQTMKDAVAEYYLRDEELLNEYYNNWTHKKPNELIKEIAELHKRHAFL